MIFCFFVFLQKDKKQLAGLLILFVFCVFQWMKKFFKYKNYVLRKEFVHIEQKNITVT